MLAAALRWADPATPAVFEMPAVPPPRDRWLTKEELRRLLALDDRLPHLRTFIHVAICTGARRESILGMQWETQFDFGRNTIWPGFKAGGKRRAMPVPMTAAAREWLEEARPIAATPWLIEWGGAPVKNVKTGLKAAYRRAGIADINAPAHVLRHTAGAQMAVDGVPLLEIAQRLGHSSVSVTERRYAHLSPEYLAKSTKALEI